MERGTFLILFLAISGGICPNLPTNPNFKFVWLETCDLNCSGPCLNTSFPFGGNTFEDLSCLNLRPGHQWTFDVIWTNRAFECDSPYGYDAFVVRNSPELIADYNSQYIWVLSCFFFFVIFIINIFNKL